MFTNGNTTGIYWNAFLTPSYIGCSPLPVHTNLALEKMFPGIRKDTRVLDSP